MVTCNTTLTDEGIGYEKPLFGSLTFHRLGLLLCVIFGLISVVIAFFLIVQHATHYLKPWEQKHIIRILLMIPIYSTVSFLSYLYYRHAIYFEVLRDCYEAFAIASFFTLLCHYVAPTLHEQKDYFRQLQPKNWFWSVFGLQKCTGGQDKGILRRPRSGLTWFNVIWIGVFQYCFIRVIFTVVAVVSQYTDRYCSSSLNPVFAHIWVLVFEGASVTIAMFCLIQFYIQLRLDLAEHKPFLKVLCIKLVIFFSFWQTLVISMLSSSSGPLKPTKQIAYQDIEVGIPSMLLCIEMAVFAVMHIFAFPWKEYSIEHNYSDPLTASGSGYSGETPHYKGGPLGIKAYLDAFNPWDIVKASARGFRWLFVGRKHRHEDPSYQTPSKLGPGAASQFGGGNVVDPPTELRPSDDAARRGRADTGGAGEDRLNLLRHAQTNGRMPSASPYRTEPYTTEPYRTESNDEFSPGDEESGLDLGSATHGHRPPGFEDTGYHGAQTGFAAVDHWAGASRGDQDSIRPPTYRTEDPRR